MFDEPIMTIKTIIIIQHVVGHVQKYYKVLVTSVGKNIFLATQKAQNQLKIEKTKKIFKRWTRILRRKKPLSKRVGSLQNKNNKLIFFLQYARIFVFNSSMPYTNECYYRND